MSGRKMNGEGSVYKRSSDGRWVGAVTLGYDERGKRIRKTVTATTKTAVLERLRTVQRQVSEGLPIPDDRVDKPEPAKSLIAGQGYFRIRIADLYLPRRFTGRETGLRRCSRWCSCNSEISVR